MCAYRCVARQRVCRRLGADRRSGRNRTAPLHRLALYGPRPPRPAALLTSAWLLAHTQHLWCRSHPRALARVSVLFALVSCLVLARRCAQIAGKSGVMASLKEAGAYGGAPAVPIRCAPVDRPRSNGSAAPGPERETRDTHKPHAEKHAERSPQRLPMARCVGNEGRSSC
eukprot:3024855-Rhodomonas_salina.2